MDKIKVGLKIRSKHLKGVAIVEKIDEASNILYVKVQMFTDIRFMNESDLTCEFWNEWNLQHTIWGFENKEYWEVKECQGCKHILTNEYFDGNSDRCVLC